jgi:hypothetical protein
MIRVTIPTSGADGAVPILFTLNGTGVPFGGSATVTGGGAGAGALGGTADPNGVVTADQFSVYTQFDAGYTLVERMWVKSTVGGNTGWL